MELFFEKCEGKKYTLMAQIIYGRSLNEKIPQDLREEINKLNIKVFSFIKENKPDSLKKYLSPHLYKKMDNLENQMPALQRVVPPKGFATIDQY